MRSIVVKIQHTNASKVAVYRPSLNLCLHVEKSTNIRHNLPRGRNACSIWYGGSATSVKDSNSESWQAFYSWDWEGHNMISNFALLADITFLLLCFTITFLHLYFTITFLLIYFTITFLLIYFTIYFLLIYFTVTSSHLLTIINICFKCIEKIERKDIIVSYFLPCEFLA